jgi:hypothetical protein
LCRLITANRSNLALRAASPRYWPLEGTIVAEIKNEPQILDRGYSAVRRMAKEMVEGGADISDILFHANQVWHEFKTAALGAGVGVIKTGMYLDQYDSALTRQLIARSARYNNGIDSKRVDELAKKADAGEELPLPLVVKAKKAGR